MEKKSYKGLLLDPYMETVTEVVINVNKEGSSLTSLYEHLGCQMVSSSNSEDGTHDAIFDDEGLYANTRFVMCQKLFPFMIIPGKMLIVKYCDNGDWSDYEYNIEQIKKETKFLSATDAARVYEELEKEMNND